MALSQLYMSCLLSKRKKKKKKIKFHWFLHTSQSWLMAWLVLYEVLQHNNILYIFSAMESVTFLPQGHLKAISPCNKNTITIPHDASLRFAPLVQNSKYVPSFHLPLHTAWCFSLPMCFFSFFLFYCQWRFNVNFKIFHKVSFSLCMMYHVT